MRTKTKAQLISLLVMFMCIVIAVLLQLAELTEIYTYYIDAFAAFGVLSFGSVLIKWLTPSRRRRTYDKEDFTKADSNFDFEMIDLDNTTSTTEVAKAI